MPNQHPNRLWQGRTFGVEMEFTTSGRNGGRIYGDSVRSVMRDALSAAGFTPRVYGDGTYYRSQHQGTAWEIKYDGSCGLEVTTPALELDADAHCPELRAGCDSILNTVRPKIDSRCGLHVHVDVSDFTWKEVQKLVAMWARYEPFFYSMVPRSRRDNMYCAKLRGQTWAEAYNYDRRPDASTYVNDHLRNMLSARTEAEFQRACGRSSRYNALRTELWTLTGRVEFRLHSGTVDYDKIRRWVTLLLTLVGRVKTAGDTTGRLARTIRPLSRPTGFGPSYVMVMMGLGPGGQLDEDGAAQTQAVYDDLIQWIPDRQRRFAGGRA